MFPSGARKVKPTNWSLDARSAPAGEAKNPNLESLVDKGCGFWDNRVVQKAYRDGIDLFEIVAMSPDQEAETKWFGETLWQGEQCCGHCSSLKTAEVPRKRPIPYWCADCRNYFSVRTGTSMARSKVPPPQVGDGHIPLRDKPKEGVKIVCNRSGGTRRASLLRSQLAVC